MTAASCSGESGSATVRLSARECTSAATKWMVHSLERRCSSEWLPTTSLSMMAASVSVNVHDSAMVVSTGNVARPPTTRKISGARPATRAAPVIVMGMSPSYSSATLP